MSGALRAGSPGAISWLGSCLSFAWTLLARLRAQEQGSAAAKTAAKIDK